MYLLKIQNGKLSQALFRMAFKEDILQFPVLPSHPSLKDKICNEGWLLYGSTSSCSNLLALQPERAQAPAESPSPLGAAACQCHLTPCFLFQIINC